MRWKCSTKEKAKILRAEGYTYSEISRKLKKRVPKSTLSFWCKSVELPDFYKEKIKKISAKSGEKGRKVALEVNRAKRKEFLNQLREKNLYLIKNLNRRTKKLLLATLYHAEGSKHPSTRHLRFASSDPKTIQFFLNLFHQCFTLDKSKFRLEIICRADQNVGKLIKFWFKTTKINTKLFYKPRIDKRTIGKKTKKKDYKGVCIIDYFDTSVQLELQLLGESLIRGYSSVG